MNRSLPAAALLLLAGTAAMAQDEAAPETAPDREPMGWNVAPAPPEDGEPMTELDRLSQSASGVTFGLELYDSRSDNPLKPVAVNLRALDKITATYSDLEVEIGEQAKFGTLTLLPRTCDKRPPEETPDTTVFLEVYSSEDDESGRRARQARTGEDADMVTTGRRVGGPTSPNDPDIEGTAIFKGWMFASSPSLNALEHPVYDVWVTDCKMVDPRI
jgi:hypothetical protein